MSLAQNVFVLIRLFFVYCCQTFCFQLSSQLVSLSVNGLKQQKCKRSNCGELSAHPKEKNAFLSYFDQKHSFKKNWNNFCYINRMAETPS